MERRPEFTVIAGANGAGKSRLSPFYVHCKSFDGDLLALKLRKEHPDWIKRWISGTVASELQKQKTEAIAQRYKAAVAERLPLKALYLYGSYSKGNHTADSDIDIAVVVERMSDDYFEDTHLLWKLKRKISNLIEPVLLVEDNNNPLYADILKTGILI